MKKVAGGVCAPAGFVAGAVRAGIKRIQSEKLDLAVVLSQEPCAAAGVFTTNRVQAAPVQVSKKHLKSGPHWGVVLNSGNANACTGRQGLADARSTAEKAAQTFGGRTEAYLVCSTGRIGVPMPMSHVFAGIESLAGKLSKKGHKDAAVAIMTSDTHPKEAACELKFGSGKVRLGSMAKGAGMICPNMATMLCLITTDLALTPAEARSLLKPAVDSSFNRITVDGDMSTNDTVLLMANGMSRLSWAALPEEEKNAFRQALQNLCRELALAIVADGEGTTRVVTVIVEGAASRAQAKRAAEAVSQSVLLKCAWAGGDPNWGRIMDALGYSGARFDSSKVQVFYDDVLLVKNGQAASPNAETAARKVAARPRFNLRILLGEGSGKWHVWSTDLTEEYVRLNLSE